MKKLFLILLPLLFLSCTPDKQGTKVTIDLRNKDASGNVSRSVTEDFTETELPFTLVGFDSNQRFNGLPVEQAKNIAKFYDAENGVKIVISKPEYLQGKNFILSSNIIYIDNNSNWTNRQNLNWEKLNPYNEENFQYCMADTVEFVYPFVLPNTKTRLVIQYIFGDPSGEPAPDFQVVYEFTPKHGLGVVDDLPKTWNSTDYTSLVDRTFSLEDVIPVEATEVVKVVTLYSTNNRSDYWNGMEWCGSYTEEILTQDDALSIVIPEDIKATKDYIFAQFVYQYNIEGFDYCHFSTVDFTSKIIDATPYK